MGSGPGEVTMDFETHPVPAHMISTGSEHLGPQFAGGKPVGPSASTVGGYAGKHAGPGKAGYSPPGKHAAVKDISSSGKHSGNVAKPTNYTGSRRAPQNISSQDRGKHAAGYSPGKDIASIHNPGKTSYEGKHRQVTPESRLSRAGKVAEKAGHAAVRKLQSGKLVSKHAGSMTRTLAAVSGK